MTLGFTESRVDSNLCFKVESGRQVILLLYVDDLFLTEKRNSLKYVVEILKRFRMMDCKAMTTPMASNLKLLSVASSDMVDATMYHQMICSLMYFQIRDHIFALL